MPTYRVTAEFDLTVSDVTAMQGIAHQAFTALFEGVSSLSSPFVETKEQASDYAAQNIRWGVTVLVTQMLAHGVKAAFPPGSTVSNVATNNNAPNDPF